MIINCIRDISYKSFQNIDDLGIFNGVFTRKGGMSPEPWKSLNFGNSVGDMETRVIKNSQYAFKAVGLDIENISQVYQVHSNNIIDVKVPNFDKGIYPKADGMITADEDVILLMRFADCVPLLFASEDGEVVGIAHAGWRGTVNRIGQKMLKAFESLYNIKSDQISVGIGPSICVDHYQVGEDVVNDVGLFLPTISESVIVIKAGRYYFDLKFANELLLKEEGVSQIEISKDCTACDLDNWFSHRAESGSTGRNGVFITKKQGNLSGKKQQNCV